MNSPRTAYTFQKTFTLGTRSAFSMYDDPIHIAFVLARYKFCARMLAGKKRVLEVGCGDAIGTPIVAEFVGSVTAIEIDPRLKLSNARRLKAIKNIRFEALDYCERPAEGVFDAVFSIDVMEHIPARQEHAFMRHTAANLTSSGICIIGTPNITADLYASKSSRGAHINLKDQPGLRTLLAQYFENVFMFGMNDEVLHTGFAPMAHYIFGMGVGKKNGSMHA